MEKKILLGVQKRRTVAINSGLLMKKKKKKKKTNQNSLLKKLVDYLKSDSYFFAPLTSSSSRFDFRSFKTSEIKEQPKENDDQRLVKKIGDYLMSDSYMYAPLVDSSMSLLAPPKGPQECIKKVTSNGFSRSSIQLKDCNKFPNDHLHEKGTPKGRSLIHTETAVAPQTTCQDRRSPSVSLGKSKFGSRIRKEIQ